MRREWTLRPQWGLLLVLMCVPLGIGVAKAPDQRAAPGSRTMVNEDMPEKAKVVPRVFPFDYHMVDLSLTVREQVDFLLTPALLVQEAISDDIVSTYPEE